MGKLKHSSTNSVHKLKKVNVSEKTDYVDKVDTSAADFIYDEVDQYYADEEREGLQKVNKLLRKPKPTYRSDILGVASSSEDEEVTSKKSRKKKKGKKAYEDAEPLPALDSDLEEGKNEDEDEEAITSQWGKKRSAYYSADYVDEDWDDADESDAEVADLEEKEALAIQQRMAQQLDEDDFGLGFITHLKEADKIKEHKTEEEQKISVNLSQLSKRGKIDLLNKESPELLELVDDFKLQMKELKENLQPILNLISKDKLPPSPGVDYIKTKYNIIMNYCTQIGYYFMLKSKRISVQNHAVIKRLVQFRSLLHQLETSSKKLQPEIDDLLSRMKKKQPILESEFVLVQPARKKLRILSKSAEKEPEAAPVTPETGKKKKGTPGKPEMLTKDEQTALEFYSGLNKRKEKDDGEEDGEEADEMEEEPKESVEATGAQGEEGDAVLEKRGINYQIAKNKGLTPHRSKEQRNPRVKHRMKFRQANIRRKGQIREPRKELKRYEGEISGIKATVVRSVKLK